MAKRYGKQLTRHSIGNTKIYCGCYNQDALWWWKFHNKPINGAIYHNMRSSKSRFKYALRAVKRSEEAIRADAMASNLLNNDYDSFWTDVKKLNISNAIISNLIDGTSGESNITNLWKYIFATFSMQILVIVI